MSEPTYTVELTKAELQACLDGLMFVNAYFGAPPDPPTPGMTAAKKLGKVKP
jgi:hypothetical protein